MTTKKPIKPTRATVVTTTPREDAGPRALDRLLKLFDVLALRPEGMSLAELNVFLQSPKSSLLFMLRPLVSAGYLTYGSGAYRLGPSIFRLAAGVLAVWSFPKLVRPFMQELVDRTGESALLSVLSRESEVLTYVEIVDSPHPVRYQIPVGTARPVYASTAGRLLLAFADKDWRDRYVNTVAIKIKTATPVTRASLVKDLEKIRRAQASVSVDGYVAGLASIASPVFNAEGRCIAAISIAGPSDRFRNSLKDLSIIVKDVASRASVAVGHAEKNLVIKSA